MHWCAVNEMAIEDFMKSDNVDKINNSPELAQLIASIADIIISKWEEPAQMGLADMIEACRTAVAEGIVKNGATFSESVTRLEECNSRINSTLVQGLSQITRDTTTKLDELSRGLTKVCDKNKDDSTEISRGIAEHSRLTRVDLQHAVAGLGAKLTDTYGKDLPQLIASNQVLTQTVASSLATVTKAKSSVKKGLEAEQDIMDDLNSRLLGRDGFTVERVGGTAQSGDILVRCSGKPDIRLESKCYASKVVTKEVQKFERDLLQTRNHGIFISVHSGIVGVRNFEIRHLSSGNFAVFLVSPTGDVVEEAVRLLYTLDSIVAVGDGRHLSEESLVEISDCVRDGNSKLESAKLSLKDVIKTLSLIQLDRIKILVSNASADIGPEPKRKNSPI